MVGQISFSLFFLKRFYFQAFTPKEITSQNAHFFKNKCVDSKKYYDDNFGYECTYINDRNGEDCYDSKCVFAFSLPASLSFLSSAISTSSHSSSVLASRSSNFCSLSSVRLILLLLTFTMQCIPVSQARLVIMHPETFVSYAVIETYFARWSPNFTEVEGYIQYFPNTCKFDNDQDKSVDMRMFPMYTYATFLSNIVLLKSLSVVAMMRSLLNSAYAFVNSVSVLPNISSFLYSAVRPANMATSFSQFLPSVSSSTQFFHYPSLFFNSSSIINEVSPVTDAAQFELSDTANLQIDKNTIPPTTSSFASSSLLPEINTLVSSPSPRESHIWLFDKCNSSDINALVQLANAKHSLALIFTETNFTDLSPYFIFFKNIFPPRAKMPVMSVDEGELISEIKRKLLNGVNVEVHIDEKPAMYLDCSKVKFRKWASLILCPMWGAVSILWYLMTNVFPCRNAANALHRFMLIPCVLRTLFHFVSFVFWNMCPDYEDEYIQYLLMFYMGLNTVFNTLFYGIILLLSRGFMITRESFDRRKSISIALMVSLVYLITSVNQVDPIGTTSALVILLLVLMFTMLRAICANVLYLQLRLGYIRAAGIGGFEDSIIVKLQIFRVLKVLVSIYFTLQISAYLFVWFFIDQADSALAAQTVLELLLYAGVLVVFRPREQVLYFSLMQDQDNNSFSILPMYSTAPLNLPVDGNVNLHVTGYSVSSNRTNRVAPLDSSSSPLLQESIAEGRPVVIINPGGGEMRHTAGNTDSCTGYDVDPYEHFAVGTPILPSSSCSAESNMNKCVQRQVQSHREGHASFTLVSTVSLESGRQRRNNEEYDVEADNENEENRRNFYRDTEHTAAINIDFFESKDDNVYCNHGEKEHATQVNRSNVRQRLDDNYELNSISDYDSNNFSFLSSDRSSFWQKKICNSSNKACLSFSSLSRTPYKPLLNTNSSSLSFSEIEYEVPPGYSYLNHCNDNNCDDDRI